MNINGNLHFSIIFTIKRFYNVTNKLFWKNKNDSSE